MKFLMIKVKQMGRKRPLLMKKLVIDSLTDSKITLKDLISEVVRLEVKEFQNKQKLQEETRINNILTF